MSRRRKHVTLGMRDEVSELEEGQEVARVVDARGGNILEVELASGRRTLCMLPQKFNKKLWIRRGGFVLVEEHEVADTKVTGTIVQVLYEEQIKQLKKIHGAWPPEFEAAIVSKGGTSSCVCKPIVLAGEVGEEEGMEGSIVVVDDDEEGSITEVMAAASLGQRGDLAAVAVLSSRGEMPRVAQESGNTAASNAENPAGQEGEEQDEDEDEDPNLPPLVPNTNRRPIYHHETESDSDDEGS